MSGKLVAVEAEHEVVEEIQLELASDEDGVPGLLIRRGVNSKPNLVYVVPYALAETFKKIGNKFKTVGHHFTRRSTHPLDVVVIDDITAE